MNRDNINNEFENEQSLDLAEIFGLLWSRIWLITAASVIGFVLAFIFTKTLIPDTYATSFSIYIKNTTNKTVMDTLNSADITAAQSLAQTYIAILNDDSVIDEIGNNLMEKYSPQELSNYFSMDEDDGEYRINTKSLRSCLSFSQVNETELLTITGYSTDPVMAADICNSVEAIAPDVLIRVVGAGAVESVGHAKIPKNPVSPNVLKNSIFGFMLGFILAVAFIIIRHMLDNTVKGVETLKNRYNMPILAEIPFYEIVKNGVSNKIKISNNILLRRFKKNKEGETLNERRARGTILDTDVPFVVTEAYNTFRTNLLFALSTTKSNVFIVSSALSGEGKSTNAANLAISIGETESRVLVIDADLRRPTQHRMFHLSNKKGLSTILAGMTNIEDAINKNVHGNTDVITSGPMPPNPSQMLTSDNMQRFIDQVSKMYDYVIIDTSPVNVVSDALIISKYTAGIVLVTRENITTYDMIDRALSSVDFVGTNILGIVSNSVDVDAKHYGKYRYKYNYNYRYNYNYNYNYNYSYSDRTDDSNNLENIENNNNGGEHHHHHHHHDSNDNKDKK